MGNIVEIAQTVIDELDSFEKKFKVIDYKSSSQISFNNLTSSKIRPQQELDKRLTTVNSEQRKLLEEPFICYIKVIEETEGIEPKEKIIIICRNYRPNIDPISKNATFATRSSGLGQLASLDIGDCKEIIFDQNHKKIVKNFILLEKSVFTPIKKDIWDATKNNIWFEEDSTPEFFRSTRKLLENFFSDETKGKDLIRELEEKEKTFSQKQEEDQSAKKVLKREIVTSISLKDQPILDKFQDEFGRLPLKSTNLLIGSPGTGKTTTLIKRINYKSDSFHLLETDEIELNNEELKNWVMFTPNELLKNYLKEAMNKENLSATDNQVITWEKEQTILGRDILKILKTADSGRFSRTNEKILLDNSSSGLIEYATQFIEFFNQSILNSFSDAITILEKNDPKPEIISKENFKIAQNFRQFTNESKLLFEQVQGRKISDLNYKTLLLIERFQRLKPNLLNLRSSIRGIVDKVLNDLILSNPEIIDRVSKLLSENENVIEQNDDDLINEETSMDLDSEEIEVNEQEDIDLKVKSKRYIRQTIIKFAESFVLKTKIKNKRILSIIYPLLQDKNILRFVGNLNVSLRQRVFNILDYSKSIEQISQYYDKFRLKLLESSQFINKEITESIKKRKISKNEIDVLIYSILQFASKIFEENRELLVKDTNFDLLENIKTRYRTQIAVDEASDFSAIQLGCIYHLAYPKYKSVTFAGDLMQRVTDVGISNWDECEFFSKQINRKQLEISYRQTPILLEVARKLYRNSIGQEPPFKSNFSENFYSPKPLKFKTDIDENLGEWIANRISEIYKINEEKLPSIAVFVPEENDIDFAFEAIQEQLNEISIDVEKCEKGRILGTGSAIRIFSVEYIKGLEFEGVFFVNIDEMQEKSDELLDKYLYVGLTRATTFLGITYKSQFPHKLEFIEENFSIEDWSAFI